ncbi:MAG: periplasmic heavy metal sensor [Neisseria sp.]|nr:periplasmic heavy metal sensor [Neisseria sp.]
MFGKFFSTLALTAALAAMTPVYAQGVQPYAPNNMPFNTMNLTAKQQQQMQKIADKYATNDARQAMQASRPFSQEMQDIIAAKTFDESKARDLLSRRNQVQNEMQLRMMRQQHEMYQVLTPEQRQIWQQNRERRWARQAQGGMRGQGMQGRQGMRGQGGMMQGGMQGQGMMQGGGMQGGCMMQGGQGMQPCMMQ